MVVCGGTFALPVWHGYLLFEGRILFEGTPEVLADNPIVREKYLGRDFVLRKREFQINDRPDARQ